MVACKIPGSRVRLARKGDYPLILDSYTHVLRAAERYAALGEVIGPAMISSLLLRLLDSQDCLVLGDAESDLVYGWALGDRERRVLHGIYVIKDARRSGAADVLMTAMFGTYGPLAAPIILTVPTRSSRYYCLDWGLVVDPRPIFDVLKG